MEKAKYLEWISLNIRKQVDLKLMDERIGDNGEPNYNLSHLVKIAGQYPDINAASCAVTGLKNPESGGSTLSANSGNLHQVPFSELLREITTDWKRQHHIEIGPFFNYVFPRLRTDKPTKFNPTLYLPHIWRQKAEMNNRLMDDGSSLGKSSFLLFLLFYSLCD
jgi:hypothetical protein